MKRGFKYLVFMSLILIICAISFAQTQVPVAAPVRKVPEKVQPPAPGHFPTGYLENPCELEIVRPGIIVKDKPSPEQPASWDWRSLSGVTSVKDQNPWGTCWIFSGIGDLESKIKLNEPLLPDQDYSEWDMWSGNAQGVDDGGGNTRQVANHFAIYGTINETDAPYHTGYRPGPPYPVAGYWSPPAGTPQKVVREWHYLGDLDSNSVSIVDTLQTYIQNNGPVSASVDVDRINNWATGGTGPGVAFNNPAWNSAWVVPYLPDSNPTDHAILICGWDDSKTWYGGGGTGAWLVKNSWGTAWGNPGEFGYFWIAYGSARIGANSNFYPQTGYKSYDSNETVMYYDEFGSWSYFGYTSDYDVYAICCFTPSFTGSRYLNYVDIWAAMQNMNYEIKVFDTWDRSGVPSAQLGSTVSGSVTDSGYYSILLNPQISLTSGNEIFIQVRFTDPGNLNYYLIPFEYQIIWFPNTKTDEINKCYSSPDGTAGSWIQPKDYGLGDVGIRGRYSSMPAVDNWLLY